MFSLTKPGRDEVEAKIAAASRLKPMEPEFLDVKSGLTRGVPDGHAHDRSRTHLGEGKGTFDAAVVAMENWKQFDLGWVNVGDPSAQIRVGHLVAMVPNTLGLWTVNLSQIVQVERTANFFGFLYKTTRDHVEEGEERFFVALDADGNVCYEIEAVSKPRHVLARVAAPVARYFQHRFVRDSHRRMREVIGEDPGTGSVNVPGG